jgi:hypothetical protein
LVEAFAEGDFDEYLGERLRSLQNEVHSQPEDYILNVNIDEYVEHLRSRYCLDVPEVRADDKFVEPREELIPAEAFPPGFFVRPGRAYPKPVLRYHVPVSGDIGLLRYTPNPRVLWAWTFGVEGNALTFDVIVWSDDPAQAKGQAEGIIRPLKEQTDHLVAQARGFNGLLERTRNLGEEPTRSSSPVRSAGR